MALYSVVEPSVIVMKKQQAHTKAPLSSKQPWFIKNEVLLDYEKLKLNVREIKLTESFTLLK